MTHRMVDVTAYRVVGPYTVSVTFDDGAEHTINFEPVLYGHYFGPLRDLTLFDQVQLDPDAHTLVWPNGADFDPATLRDWHKGDGAELARRAAQWASGDAQQPARQIRRSMKRRRPAASSRRAAAG